MSQKDLSKELIEIINNRFEHLLVDLDEAIIISGLKTQQMQIIEKSEQVNARRELLVVEEATKKIKEKKAKKANSLLKQLEANFHFRLIAEFHQNLEKPEEILNKTLGIDTSIGKLLDILYTEACTISKLVSSLERLHWLSESIIKFVRQPKYQRKDSSGELIIIDSIRAALSFLGIEMLRRLIPALIAKQALPSRSEYFPDLASNLWEFTLGSAKASEAISSHENIKWFLAYNIGMFSCLGRYAIAKEYIRTFDALQQKEASEARAKNDLNHAKAVASLTPSATYLVSLWKKHADQLTSNLLNQLKCRWLTIGIGLEDFAKIEDISIEAVEASNLHPLAKLLFQCQGFVQFKMMRNNGLLSKNASILYLRTFGIRSDEVVLLNQVNLKGLDINIANK